MRKPDAAPSSAFEINFGTAVTKSGDQEAAGGYCANAGACVRASVGWGPRNTQLSGNGRRKTRSLSWPNACISAGRGLHRRALRRQTRGPHQARPKDYCNGLRPEICHPIQSFSRFLFLIPACIALRGGLGLHGCLRIPQLKDARLLNILLVRGKGAKCHQQEAPGSPGLEVVKKKAGEITTGSNRCHRKRYVAFKTALN